METTLDRISMMMEMIMATKSIVNGLGKRSSRKRRRVQPTIE